MTGDGHTPLAGPPSDWGNTGASGVRGIRRCEGQKGVSLRFPKQKPAPRASFAKPSGRRARDAKSRSAGSAGQ